MSLGIAIGTVFSKILCSSSSSCPEVFDKRLNCKTVLNNFKEKLQCRSLFFDKAAGDFSIGLFLCIFQSFWCELLDILLLLLDDIFWCCYCFWCCHIRFLIKSSLTALGRGKAVFTLLVAGFQNVCLSFT